MLKLSIDERRALREQAHHLNPVVLIGEAGLTESVLKEISTSLDAHGLIKIRVFGDDRDIRLAIYDTICETLNAAPVQHIGKLLVVYRPKKEKKAAPSKNPGLRAVKTTKSGKTKRVLLKGNERLTAGGKIKRAKKRQTSVKKRT